MEKNNNDIPDGKVRRLLISNGTIDTRIKQLAHAITKDYKDDEEVIVVCTLAGAYKFFSKAMEYLDEKFIPGFVSMTSYVGMKSNGKPKIGAEKLPDITGKRVLVVEDIMDTGVSLVELHKFLNEKGPKDIKTAVFLNKEAKREVECVPLDYVCFDIPDRFVIGYGLDLDNKHRNLKDVQCITKKHDPDLVRDRISIISQIFTTPVRRFEPPKKGMAKAKVR